MTEPRCNGRCDDRQSAGDPNPHPPDFPDRDCPRHGKPPVTASTSPAAPDGQVVVLKYDRPNSGAYDQNFTNGPPDWHRWRTTTAEWEALGKPRTITVTITGGKP